MLYFRIPPGRSASRPWSRLLSLSLLVSLGTLIPATVPSAHAQAQERRERKLVYKVTPDYPLDLKRSHIGGMVRLDVIVTPRGTVNNISVLGGNPILVESSLRAVKRWKYAAADTETTVRVNLEFDPDH
jgi:TonB family protein